MKLITIAVLIAGIGGAASASDFSDLQRLGASGVARAQTCSQQFPPVPNPPIWPPNNWPGGNGPFPPPHDTLDVCKNTGTGNGKCLFKCESGRTLVEDKIDNGTPEGVCAQYVFETIPAPGMPQLRGGAGTGTKAKAVTPWYAVDLRSGDGTSIKLDYALVNRDGRITASPLWVNVSNPAFKGSETVTVKLMNYTEGILEPAQALRDTFTRQLSYDGSGFRDQGGAVVVYERHNAWHYDFYQELAVTVNGRQLPETFRFKMLESVGRGAERSGSRKIRACGFEKTEGETCAYTCNDGSAYTRPAMRPGPFGDEPVVPCPAAVFPF